MSPAPHSIFFIETLYFSSPTDYSKKNLKCTRINIHEKHRAISFFLSFFRRQHQSGCWIVTKIRNPQSLPNPCRWHHSCHHQLPSTLDHHLQVSDNFSNHHQTSPHFPLQFPTPPNLLSSRKLASQKRYVRPIPFPLSVVFLTTDVCPLDISIRSSLSCQPLFFPSFLAAVHLHPIMTPPVLYQNSCEHLCAYDIILNSSPAYIRFSIQNTAT